MAIRFISARLQLFIPIIVMIMTLASNRLPTYVPIVFNQVQRIKLMPFVVINLWFVENLKLFSVCSISPTVRFHGSLVPRTDGN